MAVTARSEFKNYIGGEWVGAASGETFESHVPATGEALGSFPRSAAEDVDRAVAAAKEAFEEWRLVPGAGARPDPAPLRAAARGREGTS